MPITVVIPDELAARIAAAAGESDLNDFAIAALTEKVADQEATARFPSKTFGDVLAAGWKPPVINRTPRPDGKAWSEIEAACDPA